ncbi:MAG: NTP transferase domain-containing protein [Candidatus Eisenbacteria bacterium]|uniref:NTP transferase domain-containing protein n=1 Tax=Eiseniibacteriota bacterium TaxID=2212470 RepID=A0A9D6L9Y6_UNCEI|nr:NTP transferase domain-containing protein [Candidatus Eisenbacteria bacterium]MBI3539343.1 NTP transferase domain-containing protein [Candidatus Eisenbacteria bacterium]
MAIIPVAGVGTRLRPHTHTLPKVLLHVAGKPIIAHILDDLPDLGIREAVLIVGYMGDLVREYVTRNYPRLKTHFVDQPERLGLGHAVSLAAPYVDDRPVLIILGDTIFEADLRGVLGGSKNAIGVKAVEDPRRFGIVETRDGRVTLLVEKPERPASNLAITGIYYFTTARPLFAALDEIQRKDIRTKGEFQLTDAMELMVQQGIELTTFPVEGWYDCGKTETLLETNRVLLGKKAGARTIAGSVIHAPVSIAANAEVENCIIGPYVSIAAGAKLKNAVVRDSIVNLNATIEDILIERSVVGDNAVVRGAFKRLNVGDSSELEIT